MGGWQIELMHTSCGRRAAAAALRQRSEGYGRSRPATVRATAGYSILRLLQHAGHGAPDLRKGLVTTCADMLNLGQLCTGPDEVPQHSLLGHVTACLLRDISVLPSFQDFDLVTDPDDLLVRCRNHLHPHACLPWTCAFINIPVAPDRLAWFPQMFLSRQLISIW